MQQGQCSWVLAKLVRTLLTNYNLLILRALTEFSKERWGKIDHLIGPEAKGLSSTTIVRLKQIWQEEFKEVLPYSEALDGPAPAPFYSSC